MTTRLYLVRDELRQQDHIVDASSQSQAIAAVTHPHFSARTATAREVLGCFNAGIRAIDAKTILAKEDKKDEAGQVDV